MDSTFIIAIIASISVSAIMGWYAMSGVAKIEEGVDTISAYQVPLTEIVSEVSRHLFEQKLVFEQFYHNKNHDSGERIKKITTDINGQIVVAKKASLQWASSVQDSVEKKQAGEVSDQLEMLQANYEKFAKIIEMATKDIEGGLPDLEDKIKTVEREGDKITTTLNNLSKAL